jgi:hypothetical protein
MASAAISTLLGAFWSWYSSMPPEENRDALIAIAGVAVVLWTGGLVALTLRQRFTLRLSNGIAYLQLAFLGPLLALIAHGAVLRTFALIVIVYYSLLVLLVTIQSAIMESLAGAAKFGLFILLGHVPSVSMTDAQRDKWERDLKGGRYHAFVAALGMAILVEPSDTVMAYCALALMLSGLYLVVLECTYDIVQPLDALAPTSEKPRQHEHPETVVPGLNDAP